MSESHRSLQCVHAFNTELRVGARTLGVEFVRRGSVRGH